MEKDQQKEEPSEASKQEESSSTTTTQTGDVKETQEHIEEAKEEVVSASETAPSKEMQASLASIADSLGRVEQSLVGLSGKVDAALPKPEKKEHKTPDVKIESAVEFKKVRKRGGRVVTRQVEKKK